MTGTTCTYDSGAMYDCAPMCSAPATHVVTHRNGSYGPFHSPMCDRHVQSMQGRVGLGHIETTRIGA
jgi:hypothetical protein